MSFSSRRRNYLLTPHRRDGLIEWMKSMLQHSFVLDALEETGADTFSHFEGLIEEHRRMTVDPESSATHSRLKQLVPTIGLFHTHLPLRQAFELYNEKHRLTKRKHIQISFNEIRHILNLAQIMALRQSPPPSDAEDSKLLDSISRMARANSDVSDMEAFEFQADQRFNGPALITFDGDQTLYSDGENFEKNPKLAFYLYQLLRCGVHVAVVTAAGYEYHVEKYEYRLSGLLQYFKARGLLEEECNRFYLFGGECNYLLQLSGDFHLQPVKETGPGGWLTSTKFLAEAPANWTETDIGALLDVAETQFKSTLEELKLRGRTIRKRRSVGLVPNPGQEITRESLDETILRAHEALGKVNNGNGPNLPFCAFNGGNDCWVDVGNKRVGVRILQAYLGIPNVETLHIGDQFLNTGNDFAARDVSPCIWIINPVETTYILKSILRLAGVSVSLPEHIEREDTFSENVGSNTTSEHKESAIDFQELERRAEAAKRMDVYTGDFATP